MSFILPIPCDTGEGCCRTAFTGFCLVDSTPIAIIIENGIQLGWTNLLTGVFTPGAPPAGTTTCTNNIFVEVETPPLDCLTDSVTICPGDDPIIVTQQPLDCLTDSVTICPGDDPIVVTQQPLNCLTDSVTVCQPDVSSVFTSVAQNTVSVSLLPANLNRKRAIFWNNSTSTSWIKFGATASQTSFSIRLVGETYYELDFGYTGVVDGIWLQAGAGSMRITQFV